MQLCVLQVREDAAQSETGAFLQVAAGAISRCRILNRHYLPFFIRPLELSQPLQQLRRSSLSLILGTSQAAHWLKMCRATLADTQQLGRNAPLLLGTFYAWVYNLKVMQK